MDLVQWVKGELASRGMKHNALGDHLGWSKQSLSRFMNGSRKMRGEELLETVKFFGYALPEYLGGEAAKSDVSAISRLAEDIEEDQQQALLVYLKLLPKRKDR